MEVQQWWLPSSLLEEKDALLTVRLSSDQPFTRDPWATLYSGAQGYNGHLRVDDTNYSPNRTRWRWTTTLDFLLIALDGTSHPCTLYFLDCDLTTVVARTVLSTVVVGDPPLCTLSSSSSPMPGKVLSLIVGMWPFSWLLYPGHNRWSYPGPICQTTDPWSGNPACPCSCITHQLG
jgi:hypothetical protein